MSQSGKEAMKEVGVTEEDMVAIRQRGKSQNSAFLLIVGILVSVAAFVAGYIIDWNTTERYPYSSVGAVSVASAQKSRISWMAVLIIALAALLSYLIGAAVADPPVYGYGSLYSVYSQDEST